MAAAALLMALVSSGCVPRFAYVVDSGDDSVSVYAIEGPYGRLRSLGYAPTGANPRGIAIRMDGEFAYVVNQGAGGAGSVTTFAVDADSGALTRMQDVPAGASPRGLAIRGEFLYVANYGAVAGGLGSVSGYAMDPVNGQLTPVPSPAAMAGVNPTGIVSDGSYVYVLDSGGPALIGAHPGISAYSVATYGTLTRIDANPATAAIDDFATTFTPQAIALRSDNKAVLVANGGLATISVYDIDAASGALTREDADAATPGIQDFPVGGSPRALASANGFTYIGNGAFGTSNGTLASYLMMPGIVTHIDADPSTPAIDDLPLAMPPPAVGVASTTSKCGFFGVCSYNDFVYAASAGSQELRTFSIDNTSTGAISAKPDVPVMVTRRGPVAIVMTQGQTSVSVQTRRAFVANQGLTAEGVVWSYDVDPATGALTPISTAHIGPEGPFAGRPNSVAVTPDGRYVFSGRTAQKLGVGGYTVDAATGVLGVTPGSPIPVGGVNAVAPNCIVVDPSGRFVYYVMYDYVYGFAIDSATGALTALPPVNGIGLSQGLMIAMHPTGRFLYAGERGNLMSIDRATGAMTSNGSFTSLNLVSTGAAIDPSGRFLYSSGFFGRGGSQQDGLTAFELDANTGMGTPIDADPTTTQLEPFAMPNRDQGRNVVMDPLGRFVFVADLSGGAHGIAVFRRDQSTGRLTAVDADPSTTPFDAFPVAPFVSFNVEPMGEFLYVPDTGGGIQAFRIDQTSGALTQLDADPNQPGMQEYPSSFSPAAISFWAEVQ